MQMHKPPHKGNTTDRQQNVAKPNVETTSDLKNHMIEMLNHLSLDQYDELIENDRFHSEMITGWEDYVDFAERSNNWLPLKESEPAKFGLKITFNAKGLGLTTSDDRNYRKHDYPFPKIALLESERILEMYSLEYLSEDTVWWVLWDTSLKRVHENTQQILKCFPVINPNSETYDN
jgi:hypothetical protein